MRVPHEEMDTYLLAAEICGAVRFRKRKSPPANPDGIRVKAQKNMGKSRRYPNLTGFLELMFQFAFANPLKRDVFLKFGKTTCGNNQCDRPTLYVTKANKESLTAWSLGNPGQAVLGAARWFVVEMAAFARQLRRTPVYKLRNRLVPEPNPGFSLPLFTPDETLEMRCELFAKITPFGGEHSDRLFRMRKEAPGQTNDLWTAQRGRGLVVSPHLKGALEKRPWLLRDFFIKGDLRSALTAKRRRRKVAA